MILQVHVERFALREAFAIARGTKSEAVVVVVRLEHDGVPGRGEAVPYARYGETVESVGAAIRTAAVALEDPFPRAALRRLLPAGAARAAIDLALWDLEAKRAGDRVWALPELAMEAPAPAPILQTIPIVGVDDTRARAALLDRRPIKLKLGAKDDLARVRAAREGAPTSPLVVDANEGWDLGMLARMTPPLAELGVELIEQPLPAADDAALIEWDGPIRLCADESFHGEALDALSGRYGAVNVKLDKAGGLTAALELVARAEELGLDVMLGSMVATSLAIAPATLLAARARWVDLDGALFLERDRPHALLFEGGRLHPPTAALWG